MAKGLVHLIDESIRLYGAILIWQKSFSSDPPGPRKSPAILFLLFLFFYQNHNLKNIFFLYR